MFACTEAAHDMTTDGILNRIHYFRVHSYVEQQAVVHRLPGFIRDNPTIKLVVIDSVAFHFRHDFDDMGLRSRILGGLAQSLMTLAMKHKLAVILTNQMTTKINKVQSFDRDGVTKMVPALGESWGHACTLRVILYWRNQQRRAVLYKSPTHRETGASFEVAADGIMSTDYDNPLNGTSDPVEPQMDTNYYTDTDSIPRYSSPDQPAKRSKLLEA